MSEALRRQNYRQIDSTLVSPTDSFYWSRTEAGDIVTGEVIEGFNKQRYIREVVPYIEYSDDGWNHGIPTQPITEPTLPNVQEWPNPSYIVLRITHHRTMYLRVENVI